MPLPTPSTPPTPEQIVNAASAQVTSVLGAVTAQLAPIGTAAQDAGSAITQTAQAFTSSVTQGLGAIQTAINQAISELQKQQGLALANLHDLLSNLPNINLPALITVNGQDLPPDPDTFYTTLRGLLAQAPFAPIVIEFHGPLAAPLLPLVEADKHGALRAVVLPAFGLPPNSKVLNSDPVTITALIIIAIIVLGLPLTMAVGTAIAALFLALAAVLIISAIQGRPITVDTCPNVGITGNIPGLGGVNVPMTLCTRITIG